MFPSLPLRFVTLAALALFAAAAAPLAPAQDDTRKPVPLKPAPLKPELPNTGSNHRLILKDGTYQLVRRYEIQGERVRYISVERGGDWEELPADLVDWEATRKWERDHAETAAEESSPAMKEAADLDKEEAAAREEQRAERPEVAKGLELPDEDGVWILDTYQGTPELVELAPSEMAMNGKTRRGLRTLNPLAGAKENLELEGTHAKVHLHVNDPSIFLSLAFRDDADKVVSHAMTVDTGGAREVANHKHGARSERSGFAIVRLDERKSVRIVGAIHVSVTGTVSQDENVVPAKVEVMPGKRWLKITPTQPLTLGEYALVEIVSASEINQSVWDFRVDPRLGDNPASLGPLLK
ncbi:MAG: hypothetical protein WCE75_03570 [Terracidiphilus sp.]